MRRRVLPVILAMVSAVVVALVLYPSGGRADGARVVRVVDGDTIRVSIDGRERAVRLLGIDTPETHKPGTPVECGGGEATASLRSLLPPGTRVVLEPDPSQDRVDRYGRRLAYVRLPSGGLAEEAQLRAGWASVYVYDGKPVARYAAFRRVAAEARSAGRGVWGACGGRFHAAAP